MSRGFFITKWLGGIDPADLRPCVSNREICCVKASDYRE